MQEEKKVVRLDFSQQQDAARSADGWLQGRYYSEDGLNVRQFLSFRSVFDICRFEVGVNRASDRKKYRAVYPKVVRDLQLTDLLPRAFQTLSNGEMRRVLFARAILKAPDVLVLDDPMAGLDPSHRESFHRLIEDLKADGIDVQLNTRYADERAAKATKVKTPKAPKAPRTKKRAARLGEPIVELKDISVTFDRRHLFNRFNWTIRRGEHWVLKGKNGSGKTTLTALITGDSPLGYANDVTVFGVKRGEGELAPIRRRIGMVSPEMQTYSDASPFELLEEALAREPELLILDEPCLNLSAQEAKRLLKRVNDWLKAHPIVAAIVIAHRPDHVPTGFELTVDLDAKKE